MPVPVADISRYSNNACDAGVQCIGYLINGGKLEVAQQMAAHESARTAGLYDRGGGDISLDEVERIVI